MNLALLRKLALTNQIKDVIANQSRARITPRQILTVLRLDSHPDNLIFKAAAEQTSTMLMLPFAAMH